ncbi:nucleotidyltransferase domain-containing protein, partial [Candidatus Woesearchaeota archaeon]|nr:nucleotidyltransferase domain-containing protein [Candidatus Woesearchaeota archaeon]
MKRILQDALVDITPGKTDLWVVNDVRTFLQRLALELKSRKINAKPVLGGSFAKDTWLKGDYDVDVFVAFDLKYAADDLSAMLEKALKPWNVVRVHGSRDYFQLKGKINFEIIPVLAIKRAKQAQNVTDFSPKHVAWVNSKGKRLKNDIRLFKQFCKAQRIYGAESYIRGFSGHVVDILVIYYGGFLRLLKAASKWSPTEKTVLDYSNQYKGQALMHLNESKIQGPLVVVDPVQPNRNAAAAIEQKPYLGLISAAKRFLKKPAAHLFVEE